MSQSCKVLLGVGHAGHGAHASVPANHHEVVSMHAAGMTEKGPFRPANEDRFLIRDLGRQGVVLAVADGLGGHTGGGVAAETVIQCLRDIDPEDRDPQGMLHAAMDIAQSLIEAAVSKRPELEGMGTTAVCAWKRDNTVHWYSIGDSRLYHANGRGLHQITTDQTLVQFLLEEGTITPEQAINHPQQQVLYQCIGCPDPEPELGSFGVNTGDVLLLSSDGFHDVLSQDAIAGCLTDHDDLEGLLQRLIGAALEAGSKDNITVIAARVD